jgi:hypothetical protein
VYIGKVIVVYNVLQEQNVYSQYSLQRKYISKNNYTQLFTVSSEVNLIASAMAGSYKSFRRHWARK